MVAKKWRLAGILTLLSVGLAIAAPPAVHPTTGEPLVITCLRGTPDALDGDLSDWNLAAMTPAVVDAAAQLYTGQTSWTGPEDCSAAFYLLWDDTYIYIAMVAKDDRLSMNKTSGNIWNADCAEVFFSTTNAVAPHAEHYQYGFNANNQVWNWCNMDSGGQALPNYMQAASSRTADGYICEVAIEYGRITALDWTVGNIIGFHPCVDDTDNGDRELQITWTGREAHDQSQGFGYLILSDEPAIAKELAKNPNPADGEVDVLRNSDLSWSPGDFAASHDVYLGTAFDDVNDAARANALGVLASQGQSATTFTPSEPLEYGTTYYWRIDEVNAAPDSTIFKGSVWSFTVEPFGYPITNVTATASSAGANMGPQNTVNGSGLNADDQHSTVLTDMWMSAGVKPNWIQYEFDTLYKLHELWVWNSNQLIEPFVGFGAKDVTIEYSEDGQTWTALEGVPEFAQGTGSASYTSNTVVAFGGVTAKYVKLTVDKTWGGVAPSASLSEVRFHYVPLKARGPLPASEATGVSIDADLTWRSGREATSHEVFFGADENAMTLVDTVTGNSFAPAALDLGTTYFWKVNEVGGAGPYEGDVWSFTTQEYVSIDDMESYNDDDNRIYDTWTDGWVNNTGSQVGYDVSPFAEKFIVHGGKQSMPLRYNNEESPFYSEAEREFSQNQDWTAKGADSLSLWVQGVATNGPANLYVTVEDSTGKTATATNATAVTAADWTLWTIPQSSLAGVNMARVKKMYIGVGSRTSPAKGGTGIVYVDDIGFGRPAR